MTIEDRCVVCCFDASTSLKKDTFSVSFTSDTHSKIHCRANSALRLNISARCIGEIFECMFILSFAVRSLSDLANLPITFWSSSQIAHDTRTVREHTVADRISIWSAPNR
jgi:hypothetical protein